MDAGISRSQWARKARPCAGRVRASHGPSTGPDRVSQAAQRLRAPARWSACARRLGWWWGWAGSGGDGRGRGGSEVGSSSARTSAAARSGRVESSMRAEPVAYNPAARGGVGWRPRGWRQGCSGWAASIRRTVAAARSSTLASALSCRASAWPSPWERRRPRISGRSPARRTTSMATSGGQHAPGAAARSGSPPHEALGQKPPRPLADAAALDADQLRHRRWRVSVS